jgi:class 3 adenylate cyclase
MFLHRYEYTVIGDAVNGAARLANELKRHQPRVLCSAMALHGAELVEHRPNP